MRSRSNVGSGQIHVISRNVTLLSKETEKDKSAWPWVRVHRVMKCGRILRGTHTQQGV